MATITFAGHTFADNTDAAKLYKLGKLDELKKHLDALSVAYKKSIGDPTDAILKCRFQIALNLTLNSPKENKLKGIEVIGEAITKGIEKGYTA